MRGATFCNRPTVIMDNRLQSTPHMRGATVMEIEFLVPVITSIHAPHAWGDSISVSAVTLSFYFNPRPTCVGRRHLSGNVQPAEDFNPRPTCVGRRLYDGGWRAEDATSIHAPHAWGDRYILCNFHNIQQLLSFYLIKSIISISNILYDKKSKVRNR